MMYRETRLWSTPEYLYSLSLGSLSWRMYTMAAECVASEASESGGEVCCCGVGAAVGG